MQKKLLLLSLLFCQLLTAQIVMPDFFSNGMVLQQQTDAAIWGVDKPNTKISVKGSWGISVSGKTDQNGNWKVKINTPAAGGPYSLTIKGSNTITLNDLLIGEVWFCSGQSNMEMPVKGYANQPVIGSNEAILNSSNDQIRFFNTPRAVSLTPLYNSAGSWRAANPSTTGNFSATAYFFARKVQSVLKIPVGIIQLAWGASSIESWMDKESLSGFAEKKIPDSLPVAEPNRTPTILFNSILHPYIGYTIKGILWYQGETNRENANEYQVLFSSMLQSWRKHWNQGDFPFYFVQIAPLEPGKVNAAFLREAQLKSMLAEKNVGMAVTMDIGHRTIIHPAQKETVGNRLAYWALAKAYNIGGIAYSGPVFEKMETAKEGKIQLNFTYCDLGLTSFGKPLSHFEVAGEDRVFYPAQAVFTKDKNKSITVWSEQVPQPVAVRYAFKNWAEASLFNTYGLPASSFRTDNW